LLKNLGESELKIPSYLRRRRVSGMGMRILKMDETDLEKACFREISILLEAMTFSTTKIGAVGRLI
jgi:hypothetical protein